MADKTRANVRLLGFKLSVVNVIENTWRFQFLARHNSRYQIRATVSSAPAIKIPEYACIPNNCLLVTRIFGVFVTTGTVGAHQG
jgi:hypothetical protein